MTTSKLENPWYVISIYEFQYFNCPRCSFKHFSKQDFINHTSDAHPESIYFLRNISDGSISDIVPPWPQHYEENISDNLKVEQLHTEIELEEDNISFDEALEEQESNLHLDDIDYHSENYNDVIIKHIKNEENENIDFVEGNLMTHINTVHKGNKSFKCESCGNSFTRANNLKKHIFTVHEGHKDYKCEDVFL